MKESMNLIKKNLNYYHKCPRCNKKYDGHWQECDECIEKYYPET